MIVQPSLHVEEERRSFLILGLGGHLHRYGDLLILEDVDRKRGACAAGTGRHPVRPIADGIGGVTIEVATVDELPTVVHARVRGLLPSFLRLGKARYNTSRCSRRS